MSIISSNPLDNQSNTRLNCYFDFTANGTNELVKLIGVSCITDSGNFSVVSCSNLPPAGTNKGRIIFVNDVQRHFFSDGASWTNNFSLKNSTIWTWGYNFSGQLGNGNNTKRSSPGTTSGCGITWCQINSGKDISIGIKTDCTLWTWGYNFYCTLGDNTNIPRNSPGTTAGGGNNWCQASSNCRGSGAIKIDGTLWTWGRNGFGELGDGTTTDRNSPGTTEGCGTTWCQVSFARNHALAVKTNGTLWTWGRGEYGALGNNGTAGRSSPGTTEGCGTTWCQVSGGRHHSLAIKTDGTLWTWGRNVYGQLGDGTTTNRSSPGTTAGGGTTWCASQFKFDHTSAIKTDGTLWTWGRNHQGQLGDGTTTNRSSPGTTAGGGTTWCSTSASFQHTIGLKSYFSAKNML